MSIWVFFFLLEDSFLLDPSSNCAWLYKALWTYMISWNSLNISRHYTIINQSLINLEIFYNVANWQEVLTSFMLIWWVQFLGFWNSPCIYVLIYGYSNQKQYENNYDIQIHCTTHWWHNSVYIYNQIHSVLVMLKVHMLLILPYSCSFYLHKRKAFQNLCYNILKCFIQQCYTENLHILDTYLYLHFTL